MRVLFGGQSFPIQSQVHSLLLFDHAFLEKHQMSIDERRRMLQEYKCKTYFRDLKALDSSQLASLDAPALFRWIKDDIGQIKISSHDAVILDALYDNSICCASQAYIDPLLSSRSFETLLQVILGVGCEKLLTENKGMIYCMALTKALSHVYLLNRMIERMPLQRSYLCFIIIASPISFPVVLTRICLYGQRCV